MEAKGEHLLIKKPNQKKASEGGILMPDNYDRTVSYGRVMSSGDQAIDEVGNLTGRCVAFDPAGVRELELDALKDADVVVVHYSQVFCTIEDADLEMRKLPIP